MYLGIRNAIIIGAHRPTHKNTITHVEDIGLSIDGVAILMSFGGGSVK